MAIIKFHNGTQETVSADIGAMIWGILQSEIEPNEKQEAYVASVADVILSWRNAPDSYIKRNLPICRRFGLNDWVYSRDGMPVKPEGDFGWKFAKRWGLWENGKKTSIVNELAVK